MCGIIGYVGNRIADRVLVDGLKRLEYRGYDSSGIAVLQDDKLEVFRKVGKLINLESMLAEKALTARLGIGHTRWATHGKPSEQNAHPHLSDSRKIAVVHNGIIENYASLKSELSKKYKFNSDTDTEVISHLLEKYYDETQDLLSAFRKVRKELKGSFAIAAICLENPDEILVAKQNSPLIIGLGTGEMFVASDITAVLSYTNKIAILEDGDIAVLSKAECKIYDGNDSTVIREPKTINWDPVMAEKGGYKHFMLKEIYEQPVVIEDTLRGRIDIVNNDVILDNIKLSVDDIKSISRVVILACGTSYHSGLIGKFLFEDLVGLPCEVDIASEFRYRTHANVIDKNCLVIPISQSGETADTIASFEETRKIGTKNLAICNVMDSTLARKADSVVYTRCGPEIGVASTKAFTAQLAVLYLVALYLGKRRGFLQDEKISEILSQLVKIPLQIEACLKNTKSVMEEWAKKFYKMRSFLYLGRNINYPIALEGALKLKEISYIHAEGYPAGEMKHGPIALIDENMPVLTIATQSSVYEKIASNLAEARARNGQILALASEGNVEIKNNADFVCYLPKTLDILSPILNIVPLQFLAYFIGEMRGCDVDQPRNLAKSVTVE